MLTVINLGVHNSFKKNYENQSNRFAIQLYFLQKILQVRAI